MECNKIIDLIWIEDELSESENQELYKHINTCKKCKEEYDMKNLFEKSIKNYGRNLDIKITDGKKKNKLHFNVKWATIAASFLIVSFITVTAMNPSLANAINEKAKGIFNIFNYDKYGKGYLDEKGLTQEGKSIEKEDIKISVKSIAVSKTNVSIFYTIEDVQNPYNSCSAGMTTVEGNGETFNYRGTFGKSFVDKISYASINIDFSDKEIPKSFVIKLKDINIEKNVFSDTDTSKDKGSKTKIEGIWEAPIDVDDELLSKANNEYTQYKLNKEHISDGFNIKFTGLNIEASKSVLKHTISSPDNFFKIGSITVISSDDKVVLNGIYKNNNIEYTNEDGKPLEKLQGFTDDSDKIKTTLPSIAAKDLKKIVINSYLTCEKLSNIEISSNMFIDNRYEKSIGFGNISIEKGDLKGKTQIKINYKGKKTGEFKLIKNGIHVSSNDMQISVPTNDFRFSEPQEDNDIEINGTYELDTNNESLELQFWGYEEHSTNIEIPLK